MFFLLLLLQTSLLRSDRSLNELSHGILATYKITFKLKKKLKIVVAKHFKILLQERSLNLLNNVKFTDVRKAFEPDTGFIFVFL